MKNSAKRKLFYLEIDKSESKKDLIHRIHIVYINHMEQAFKIKIDSR